MENKVGTYEYRTDSYSLDFRGQLPLPALGNYLLHAATSHATGRGFGFEDMQQRKATWVLSKLAIEIHHPALLAGALRIHTWVERVERIFTFRCFEITTLAGDTIGYARSVWAAIDRDTRRPISLEGIGLSEFVVARDCPVDFSSPQRAEQGTQGIPYTIKYSDLDINGHFNSIKYMESILDLFDIEVYRTSSIARFEIIYQSEGWYGMTLMLHQKEMAAGEYAAAICNEGKPICRANVSFMAQ
ncbi:MAG: acyl-[acyl-carrier-protein] thioesterase [Tannerella sp.]|jgi:acyl-ACP thioesterase|nr:acyl-[acyl-carrier-protein] thioesterase [Tannerella sp.]